MRLELARKGWPFQWRTFYNARLMDTSSPIPLDGTVFTVEIENSKPIELIDLTESFLSLGDEYNRFVSTHPEFSDSAGVKLYIKKITSSSVKADIIAMGITGSQMIMPIISDTNSLIAFAKFLKSTYDYFLGKEKEQPAVLQKADYANFLGFVQPVSKDHASQVNVSVTYNGAVQQAFYINSSQANAAQNTIKRTLEKLREPDRGTKRQVVLYWEKGAPHTKAGNRGIIESIWPTDVKVVFEDDRVKQEMLLSAENPFRFGYLVDVSVETIDGKPVLYKVTRYYELVDKPDDSNPEASQYPQSTKGS